MTAAFLWAGKMALLPLRFSYLTWVNAWPVVLTTNLVATATRRSRIIGLVLYFSVGIALGILLLQRSPDLTTFQLAYLWSDASLIPSVLLLFFLNRRIRAVGPLVLVFMIVGAIGATLLVSVSGSSPKLLRAIANFSHTIGLGAGATVVSLHLLGFAVFAIGGWVILDSLRQMYERKYLSDRSVTVGTIWLIFGIVNSMGLVFQGTYLDSQRGGCVRCFQNDQCAGVLSGAPRQNAMGPRLLLLRVFALGRRSERLYDALANTGAPRAAFR